MGVGLELLGERGEEQAHGRGGRLGQGKGEGLVGAGPTSGEQVEALEPLVGQPGRAHPTLVPAVADPALLPDPGLILAPELDPHARVGFGDFGELRAKLLFRTRPARPRCPAGAKVSPSGARGRAA